MQIFGVRGQRHFFDVHRVACASSEAAAGAGAMYCMTCAGVAFEVAGTSWTSLHRRCAATSLLHATAVKRGGDAATSLLLATAGKRGATPQRLWPRWYWRKMSSSALVRSQTYVGTAKDWIVTHSFTADLTMRYQCVHSGRNSCSRVVPTLRHALRPTFLRCSKVEMARLGSATTCHSFRCAASRRRANVFSRGHLGGGETSLRARKGGDAAQKGALHCVDGKSTQRTWSPHFERMGCPQVCGEEFTATMTRDM